MIVSPTMKQSPTPKAEFGGPGTFYSWKVGCLAVDAILADL